MRSLLTFPSHCRSVEGDFRVALSFLDLNLKESFETMDISSALTVASKTLELVKGLRTLDHELDKAELKSAMADLYGDLSDIKMALADAQRELAIRDQKIKELEQRFKGSETLVEKNGFHFSTDESGKPRGLPFCPSCLARDGTQIRPADVTGNMFICPGCQAVYSNLENYK